MQELIENAKAGKSAKRIMSHKEFVRSMKSQLPENFQYEKCSDAAKNKWLSIVNANKKPTK